MKKNKKILLLIGILFLLTGCTKQLKDVDGNVVKDENTNQVLVENILCQPNELKDKYIEIIEQQKEKYKEQLDNDDITKKEYKKKISSLLDIEELPVCTSLNVFEGKYENIWTNVFIKPLAWLLIKIGNLLKNNYGLSIIIVTILIKLVLFPFSYKSLKQSENIQKAQPKLNKLEQKYKGKNDQESMMMKSNEMMAIYKEYKINPVSGCLLSFIQIPLFFAFYEALYRLPLLFEGKFLIYHMGKTPLSGLQSGEWLYLILPVLVLVVTYYSFKMNKNTMSQDQAKQMNMMFNIMIIMIFITSFSMSTAIILYWITNSVLTIFQNLLIKRSNKK